MVRFLFILFAASCGIAFLGYDGWQLNRAGNQKTFTIEEIEKNGLDRARWVKITGGIPTDKWVEITRKKSGVETKKFLAPIVSHDTYYHHDNRKKISVRLIADVHPDQVKQLETLEGIARVGISQLDSTEHDTFARSEVSVPENVVVLEVGAKPGELSTNLTMFFGGIVAAGLIAVAGVKRAVS